MILFGLIFSSLLPFFVSLSFSALITFSFPYLTNSWNYILKHSSKPENLYTTLFQALIPLCLGTIPQVLINFVPKNTTAAQICRIVYQFTLHWSSFFQGVANIYFVHPLRNCFIHFFKRKRKIGTVILFSAPIDKSRYWTFLPFPAGTTQFSSMPLK